ncbi:general secretion pathway protein GspB [Salinisphaera sp. LB1]|uniref:general secretion pathway protein GspB n=1 Tax=Salinisphaera sp. LB1 TaxID=2183911 RepID=UPI000D705EBE|nr:general secretion pathway protein GspB [Salinisphaera sp. LB1]AWN17315.1 General secretion pathway protein B [Salinisphaera sp. LB1]
MSYLVDALKKAERERYARQEPDIQVLSAGAAALPAGQRSGPWLWLMAILVATNVALAIYVWRAQPGHPASAVALADAPPLGNSDKLTRFAPGLSLSIPDNKTGNQAAEPAPSTPATPRGGTTRSDRNTAATAAASPSTGRANRVATRTNGDSRSHERVRYSNVPLTGDGATDAAPASRPNTAGGGNGADAPDQSAFDDVPSVDINGQLYSSVPGRSFILVNGRRYHEGERLAAGPAVESIGPNGATLRYHGRRYHVAGPG